MAVQPNLPADVVICGSREGIIADGLAHVPGVLRCVSHEAAIRNSVDAFGDARTVILLNDESPSAADVAGLDLKVAVAAPSALAVLQEIKRYPRIGAVVLVTSPKVAMDQTELLTDPLIVGVIESQQPETARHVERALDRATAVKSRLQSSPLTPLELLNTVGIVAVSPAMQQLIVQAARAAKVSDATVLILGESGTGKQLLSEAIHRLDPKRGKHPFVPVNCAAITGTLAESELFGHARGAFSGATGQRAGYFKSAHGGTIMLDEISELPLSLQPKLLRVLQEGRVLPVGADREEPIDVRVIAASNVSLADKVNEGTFRLDLYQRLNVVHLRIPPLAERLEDLPLLVNHFLKKYRHYSHAPVESVSPEAIAVLRQRLGNGNVRELENVVRQSLVFKETGTRLEIDDLPRSVLDRAVVLSPSEMLPTTLVDNMVALIRSGRLSLRSAIDTFEQSIIRRTVESNPHLNKSQIAQALGLPRRTLYHKLDTTGRIASDAN
jgi:transcriptional regulator with PAS, ATPase and Fis domain